LEQKLNRNKQAPTLLNNPGIASKATPGLNIIVLLFKLLKVFGATFQSDACKSTIIVSLLDKIAD
jgi:hypothetical protein